MGGRMMPLPPPRRHTGCRYSMILDACKMGGAFSAAAAGADGAGISRAFRFTTKRDILLLPGLVEISGDFIFDIGAEGAYAHIRREPSACRYSSPTGQADQRHLCAAPRRDYIEMIYYIVDTMMQEVLPPPEDMHFCGTFAIFKYRRGRRFHHYGHSFSPLFSFTSCEAFAVHTSIRAAKCRCNTALILAR